MANQKTEPCYEPNSVVPAFVDSLAVITQIGAVTHLLFTVRRPGSDGKIERIVEARLIVPTEELKAIGAAILTGRAGNLAPTGDDGESAALH